MLRSLFENSADLNKATSISLFTRILKRTLHAHEVFFLFPEKFSAILEDSRGNGRHFLVSKSGRSSWLKHGDNVPLFFDQWKQSIKPACCHFPAIQQLVYASYEVSTLFEALPLPKTSPPSGLLWLHEPEWSICFDSELKTVYLASRISEKQLDDIACLLATAGEQSASKKMAVAEIQEVANDYCYAVKQVKDYICAGDIFQANIARFWNTACHKDQLLGLYKHLRRVNPAPFSCFLRADDLSIVSASPERLFSLSSDGIAEARPIAGTRRRSQGDEDQSLRDELLLSDKECSEHIMLVDLERNDLGRVCEPGSVEVNERMVIEQYATVQHIVSNVRGKLSQDHDVMDLFRAMFPGGTITGCPKVRCMEIIHELEHQARGPYTGSVGYIAFDGSADMNILIRTFWHDGKQLHWAAGAGIVADSDPELERIETEHKVAGLLRALHANDSTTKKAG
ncbi:MAG: chorismate-binding protein [Mariprofundaceae bacterium]|nr:chorismate-binding protein [Mariprofundaceae bacterium]